MKFLAELIASEFHGMSFISKPPRAKNRKAIRELTGPGIFLNIGIPHKKAFAGPIPHKKAFAGPSRTNAIIHYRMVN
jgi:hypothetical protein